MPPSEQPADGMGISPVTPSSSTPLELINPGPLLASQLAAMAAMAALENPSQELVVEAPNPQLAAEAPSPESSP